MWVSLERKQQQLFNVFHENRSLIQEKNIHLYKKQQCIAHKLASNLDWITITGIVLISM